VRLVSCPPRLTYSNAGLAGSYSKPHLHPSSSTTSTVAAPSPMHRATAGHTTAAPVAKPPRHHLLLRVSCSQVTGRAALCSREHGRCLTVGADSDYHPRWTYRVHAGRRQAVPTRRPRSGRAARALYRLALTSRRWTVGEQRGSLSFSLGFLCRAPRKRSGGTWLWRKAAWRAGERCCRRSC
jgi:hypothetical protein